MTVRDQPSVWDERAASADASTELAVADSEYVLTIRGDADIATAPVLAAALAAASERGHRRIVLDLEALEFIDAHCLGVIAAARHAARDRSELVFRAPSPVVLRLLDILHFDVPIDPPVPENGTQRTSSRRDIDLGAWRG